MVPSKACGSAKSTKWIQTQQGASGGFTAVWTRKLTHFFAFMLLIGDQGYLSVYLDMCVWKYNYPSLINLQTESSIHCKSLKQTSLFIFYFFFFFLDFRLICLSSAYLWSCWSYGNLILTSCGAGGKESEKNKETEKLVLPLPFPSMPWHSHSSRGQWGWHRTETVFKLRCN